MATVTRYGPVDSALDRMREEFDTRNILDAIDGIPSLFH